METVTTVKSAFKKYTSANTAKRLNVSHALNLFIIKELMKCFEYIITFWLIII